jgi:hydrogenase/urease accessory protein HupE
MHTKTTLFTLFALTATSLAAAHPGHAGHTHGETFSSSALDALAGSGHPKVLLAVALLAAGVLIAVARAARVRAPELLLERDHRHRFGRQTQD